MQTLFQNLLNVFRLYKWATILNIVGLSLAFTTFYVISRQSWYEFSFNKSIKDYENIFRLEMDNSSKVQSYFPHPVLTKISQSTPHLRAAGKKYFLKKVVSVASARNPNDKFNIDFSRIDKGYTDVFGFDWISGDVTAFEVSEDNIIIPQSLAEKLFATSDVAGEMLWMFTANGQKKKNIVAVYRDFSDNTSIGNHIYNGIGSFESESWNDSNYEIYLKLNVRDNIENVERSIVLPDEYLSATGKSKGELTLNTHLFPIEDLYFYSDDSQGDIKITWLLLGVGCLILFIAVINFVNFSMALAPTRMRSVNTQKVLGATVASLRMQYLLECIIISVIAYGFSLIEILLLNNSGIVKLLLTNVSLGEGWNIAVFCGALSVVVGFLAGLWPSVYITSVPPALALKGSYRLSPRGLRLRNTLVGIQFFITFVLLVVSIFVYLQNCYMLYSPLGLDKDRVVVMNIEDVFSLYYNPEIVNEINKGLREYSGTQQLFHSDNVLFDREGRMQGWGEYDDNGNVVRMKVLLVDRDFVPALNIKISEGRMMNADENRKALVNESAGKQYGFKIGDVFRGYEIIGFVPDIKVFSFYESNSTPFGLFFNDNVSVFYIKLASGVEEKDALAYCRDLMAKVCPNVLYNVRMLTEEVEKLYEKDINQMYILSLFCGLSMFISIMGIFGLVIFELQSRRKEIGIRKINGATVLSVIGLFNKTYLRILLICFVMSVPVAWYLVQRWLETYVYRIPVYWWVFAVAFFILLIITSATVSLQCWHTANENPIKSIKVE